MFLEVIVALVALVAQLARDPGGALAAARVNVAHMVREEVFGSEQFPTDSAAETLLRLVQKLRVVVLLPEENRQRQFAIFEPNAGEDSWESWGGGWSTNSTFWAKISSGWSERKYPPDSIEPTNEFKSVVVLSAYRKCAIVSDFSLTCGC